MAVTDKIISFWKRVRVKSSDMFTLFKVGVGIKVPTHKLHVKDKTDPTSREWKTRSGYMPDVVNGHKDFINHRYGGLCHKPFEVVYIDYQGNYNLCCDVWHNIEVLENIYTQPIKEYTTKNKRLMEYRKNLMEGKRSLKPCNACNVQCSVSFLQKVEDLRNANRQSGYRS